MVLSLVTFYNVKLESSPRLFRVLVYAAPATTAPLLPNSVLRGLTPEPQSKTRRGWLAPSLVRIPVQSIKQEMTEEEEDVELPTLPSERRTSVAHQLLEYNEGPARKDVQLRALTKEKERQLFFGCRDSQMKHKPVRYAVLLFRNLAHYEDYSSWVGQVNYAGLQSKEALPVNLRRTMRALLEYRFSNLRRSDWNKIRDAINADLRVKKKEAFFSLT